MVVWCYADLWEAIAAAVPDRYAVIQGDEALSWRELDAHANALAAHLLAAGITHQAKLGIFMPNRAEYMVAQYAAYKASFVPFNINYRYGAQELVYLLGNADAEAVVFDAQYTDLVEAIRADLPKVTAWVCVGAGSASIPEWATNWSALLETRCAAPVRGPWGRSGDDLMLIYTGGTTGMPKGVMWRQENALGVHNFGANPLMNLPSLKNAEEAGQRALALTAEVPITLVACPLMHGTGLMSAVGSNLLGGTLVLLNNGKFDAEEAWDTVDRRKVTRMTIVGLSFATPLLEALDANPGRWDLSSLSLIGSAGAMWSQESKRRFLEHLPHLRIGDAYGASEAFGLGASTSTRENAESTARFIPGPKAAVFTEDGRRVVAGSGERGFVAVTGHIPLGYYKDEEKTAKTFRTLEGKRWSVPGDWAEVNADGSLKLLGRGSQSINTGGEKVFPEEVEEALKRHPSVRDAAVVGVPDARFGERICAIVEPRSGQSIPDLQSIRTFIKTQLADYKAPREVISVTTLGRAPNGKLDYRALRTLALAGGTSD